MYGAMMFNWYKKFIYRCDTERALSTYFDTIVNIENYRTPREQAIKYTILWRIALKGSGPNIEVIDRFVQITGIKRQKVARYLLRKITELHQREADEIHG